MRAGHKIDYNSRKQKGKHIDTNSNKCEDSKLHLGDIVNSFFDAFKSNACHYNDGIQLSMTISI